MTICCDDVIGGLIQIIVTFSGQGGNQGGGQQKYEAMGEVRIQTIGVTRASGATSWGHVWVTEAARPLRILCSYPNRCGLDPLDLFKQRCRLLVTVIEWSRGFQHTFTDCIATGEVENNLTTGEVTGIELVCNWDQYSKSEFPIPAALDIGGGGTGIFEQAPLTNA
jgi:hypothetical protein